jgi:hypothetical protein
VSETAAAPTIQFDDSSLWLSDGPLKEVLAAFNDRNPVALASAIKTALANGFTVVGTADFMGTSQAKLTATVTKSGDITLNVELTNLQVSRLLRAATGLALPRGFDVVLPTSWIVVRRSGGSLSLQAAASSPGLGEFVFTASHAADWQVAAGFQLDVANLAALPGLSGSPLAALDRFVGLSDLMMVLSSHDDADFDFPDLGSFQVPALGTGKVVLPGQSGGKLVKGLNIYAGLSTTTGGGFRSLAKFLHLRLDGSLGLTIAVSLPDPADDTKLFLSVTEQIKAGITLTGELGFLMRGGAPAAFLTGTVVAPIQDQPTQFDATAVVLANGVMVSGSMQNPAPVAFHIDSVRFALADLGLVVGIDDEGIPSLGFCATLDIDQVSGSLALFVDSATPQNSMFAAAISGLSMLDVVEKLARQTTLSPALRDVFDQFALKPLASFALPGTFAQALDQRDIAAIVKAFGANHVALQPGSDQILLDINTPGKLWYLTDTTTMTHYVLRAAGNGVAVSLEPQLYVAPQATSIGAITFPKGFKVTGELDLLLLHARVDIEITGVTGIYAGVFIDPITILGRNFVTFTGTGPDGGPFLSLATYARPQDPDPNFRQPHFAISGVVRLLGHDFAGIYISFSKVGLVFQLQAHVTPVIYVNLAGTLQNPQHFRIGGAIQIGVNNQIDLGPLGSVHVNVEAFGALNVGMNNGVASATFQAGLVFQGWSLQTPLLQLDVNVGALPQLAATLLAQLEQMLIGGLRADVQRFLAWARAGVLAGMQDIGRMTHVLKTDYHLSADAAARELRKAGTDVRVIAGALKHEFGSSAEDVAKILKNDLGQPQDAIKDALKGAGYAAKDIDKGLGSAFNWAKSHLNPSHW